MLFLEKLDARRFEASHPFVQWASDNYPCPLEMKSTPIMQLTALPIGYFGMDHNAGYLESLLFLPRVDGYLVLSIPENLGL